jgi:phage terminase large subunit-like protein
MKTKRNRQRGKEVEKRVAKKLNGERKGVLGGVDVETEDYAVEVKSRKRLVIDKWWDQAEKNAKKKRKAPLLICHVFNTPRYYVVLKIEQFNKLKSGDPGEGNI